MEEVMKSDIERIKSILKCDTDAAIIIFCYITNKNIKPTDENIQDVYNNVNSIDFKEIDEFIKKHILNNISSKEMNILLRFKKRGISLNNIKEKTKYSLEEIMNLLNKMRDSYLVEFDESLENPENIRLTILGERVVNYLRNTYEL